MLIHIVNQFRVKLNENIVDSDDKIAKMGGKTYIIVGGLFNRVLSALN